ncbi:MAG: hypothetical protein J6C98_05230 [Oscillospiraceae bacterium]|nr:hypothetical protein [Oscillospiraceae bacterium]
MEHIWGLLKAVFFLVTAIVLMLFAYLFQNTALAVICVYGAFFLFLIGVCVGAFMLIDHHNASQKEEKSE